MTTDTLIMLVGALVAVLPFLGFPNNWDTVIFFIAGIVVISLGIVVRRRDKNTQIARPAHHVETAPRVVDEDESQF